MKQWQDAAMLFEKAGAFEKAAEIHINTKNFAQAAPLMNSITTPKLHLLYAQAKEAEGDYIAACQAYEKARDLDAVVRLNLDHMRNPQHAMQVVRETRSTEVRISLTDTSPEDLDVKAELWAIWGRVRR